MKYGFIRTAAATPDIKVCDCDFNADNIIKNIKTAYENNTEIIVFPELVITGYTCGDLSWSKNPVSERHFSPRGGPPWTRPTPSI